MLRLVLCWLGSLERVLMAVETTDVFTWLCNMTQRASMLFIFQPIRSDTKTNHDLVVYARFPALDNERLLRVLIGSLGNVRLL